MCFPSEARYDALAASPSISSRIGRLLDWQRWFLNFSRNTSHVLHQTLLVDVTLQQPERYSGRRQSKPILVVYILPYRHVLRNLKRLFHLFHFFSSGDDGFVLMILSINSSNNKNNDDSDNGDERGQWQCHLQRSTRAFLLCHEGQVK